MPEGMVSDESIIKKPKGPLPTGWVKVRLVGVRVRVRVRVSVRVRFVEGT